MTKRKKQVEFVKWFGPLLDALRDLGDSGKPREVSNRIATNLNLSDEILDETLKSGVNKFHNQVAWARQYLVWEGLLDSSKYGTWKLTEKGKDTTLTENDGRKIFLKWVDIHQKARKEKNENALIEEQEEKPPEEFEKVELGVLPKIVYEVDMNYFKKFMDE